MRATLRTSAPRGRWRAAAAPGELRRVRLDVLAINGLLLVGALFMVFPFLWMLLSSLKPTGEIIAVPPTFLPGEWHWQNYVEAWNRQPFARYYLNSFIIASNGTISSLLFASMAGFGFAKHRFRGQTFFFLCILTSLMIPVHVLLVPRVLLARDLGWIDTLWGLLFPDLVTPFGAFLMTQFMRTIPDEIIDAARIDGASEPRIYWQVMIPLSVQGLAALAIMKFIWLWDDFLWPLVIVNSAHNKTLPLGLAAFQEENRIAYAELMAAATFVILPVLLVFLVMQRQFVQGISLTGLKG
jgi:multiple sugar transport system permease protein